MLRKIIVVCTLFVTVLSIAQKNNTSAYSFFGVGDKNDAMSVEQLSMGGVAVAFSDAYHLNFANAASNSSLLFTTYTMALENMNMTAKDANNKENAATTFLSYIAVGIPFADKGGMAFGLLPNSTVGYSIISNITDVENNTLEATQYTGEGGTNKVFLNFAYKPLKDLSIGVQGNYVFGKIENNIINQVKDVALATRYQTISYVKGFSVGAGFQYKKKINEKIELNLGGSFDLENTVTSDGNEYLYSVVLANSLSPRDTIVNNSSSGKIITPLKSTVGIGIGKENKWFAGVDYSTQEPIKLQGDIASQFSKISYDKYSRISVGGFYLPKINSISSYWERVTYRAGIKYENTGLMVDGNGNGTDFTPIKDFGISFGVGLPLSKQLSNLNVGFEIGKRGETANGLVQENYINFRLSMSLNDKWFKKVEIF